MFCTCQKRSRSFLGISIVHWPLLNFSTSRTPPQLLIGVCFNACQAFLYMGSAYFARSLTEVQSKPSGEGSTPSNRFCKGLSEKKNALQEVQCSVLV